MAGHRDYDSPNQAFIVIYVFIRQSCGASAPSERPSKSVEGRLSVSNFIRVPRQRSRTWEPGERADSWDFWLTASDGGLTKLSGLHLSIVGHLVGVGAEPTTGLTMVPAVKAAHLPERI